MQVKLTFYNPKNKSVILAWEAHCIPNLGESVKYNQQLYRVTDRVFDYDKNTVILELSEFFYPEEE